MRLKIVVADDQVDTAQTMKLLLEAEGHAVDVAYNGTDAVDLITNNHPDLALIDISMPGISGLDVARLVGESGPHLFLVAVTGWDVATARDETAAAGFHAHLVKPVSPESLRTLAQKVARQKRALSNH